MSAGEMCTVARCGEVGCCDMPRRAAGIVIAVGANAGEAEGPLEDECGSRCRQIMRGEIGVHAKIVTKIFTKMATAAAMKAPVPTKPAAARRRVAVQEEGASGYLDAVEI